MNFQNLSQIGEFLDDAVASLIRLQFISEIRNVEIKFSKIYQNKELQIFRNQRLVKCLININNSGLLPFGVVFQNFDIFEKKKRGINIFHILRISEESFMSFS